MFRRTLIALVAVLTLGLLITVGYAVLGLSGPQTTVDDAVVAYQRAEFTKSVRLLDRAEKSLGRSSNPELRARILQLRREAHLRVDNLPRALADIDAMRQLGDIAPSALEALGVQREQLELDKIYYTLRAEDNEGALELAQQFMHDHEEHARGLELAGEASYAIFADKYNELRKHIDRLFDENIARRADEYLKVWLYRDQSDPLARRSRVEFEALIEQYRPGDPITGQFQARLEELRRLIQQAQRYCRRAIVAPGGQPVAAYRLLRTSLDKGRRYDDIQALAETYLLRFDHIYTVDAAADLAELHVANGRYRAAREIADRYLAPGTWRERVDAGKLSAEVRRLYAAKARALVELKDSEKAAELAREVEDIQASGLLNLAPEFHLIRSLTMMASHRMNPAMDEIDAYLDLLREQPQTPSVRKKLYDAILVKSDIGRARNWPPKFFIWMQNSLARYAPDEIAPLIKLAELHLLDSEGELAQNAAYRAHEIDGLNDDVLRIRARVFDFIESNAGRGSSSLLENFLRVGVPPNISNNHLWPIIAEKALAGQHWEVAHEAARRASDAFNWAKWPRILQADAAMGLDQPKLAAQAAESLLTFYPNDADGLRLLSRARLALGQSIDDLLYGSLLKCRTDAAVARSMLGMARARQDHELASAIAQTIELSYADDAEAQLMIAQYYLSRDQRHQASKAVTRASALVESPADPLYAQTRASALLIASLMPDSSNLEEVLSATKKLLYGNTAELYRYARTLSALAKDNPGNQNVTYAMAYDLLRPLLTDDIHKASRSGVHFEFGGELALRLGKLDQAEEHLLSALTFEDGVGASRILTLIYLAADRNKRPADTFWEQRSTDLVSACLHARGGKKTTALLWAEQTLASTQLNLPALCLLALLDPTFDAPPELREVLQNAPDALLDALTYTDAAGFEATAVHHALQLVQRFPSNRFCLFLLARAYSNSGAREPALALLAQLMAPHALGEFLWAHEEVARLIHTQQLGGAAVSQAMSPFLSAKATFQQTTPELNAIAIRTMVDKMFDQPEQRDNALTMLARLWQSRPENVGLADVVFLEDNNRPDLALRVWIEVERLLPPDQRATALQRYFAIQTKLAKLDALPDRLDEAKRKAERIVRDEGAYGAVVHFLLQQNPPIDAEGRKDPDRADRAIELLTAHFLMFQQDRDRDTELLIASLEQLKRLVPAERLLATTDRLMQHDPSIPALWMLRADWLEQDGRIEEATDSLRWIEHFLPFHPARLRIAELRARLGGDDLRIETQLRRALGDATFDSDAGALARAILALRAGEYQRAAKEYSAAPPSPDGTHIYYHALALLALGQPTEAAVLFKQLTANYPQSLVSENAEQFARFCSH